MSNDHDTAIRKTVHNLVNAENNGNSVIADSILSKDFIGITRSSGTEQNRVKLIEAIDSSRIKIKRELNEEHLRVFNYGTVAISRSLVTVKEDGKEDTFFRNIQVFENEDGKWLCKIWQVTKLISLNEAKEVFSSLGKTLEKVEIVSTEMQQKITNKTHEQSDSMTYPTLVSKQEDKKILNKEDEILKIIIKDKNDIDYDFIKAYRVSMMSNYKIWSTTYPKLAVESDPVNLSKIQQKLDDIIKMMCSDWHILNNYMKAIGVDLTDEYYAIKFLCEKEYSL